MHIVLLVLAFWLGLYIIGWLLYCLMRSLVSLSDLFTNFKRKTFK